MNTTSIDAFDLVLIVDAINRDLVSALQMEIPIETSDKDSACMQR